MRELELTFEQQLRLVNRIGPALDRRERGRVSNVVAGGILGNSELDWHSDVLFTEHPYLGVSLFAVDVEPPATSTRFASGPAALSRSGQRRDPRAGP